ncbi:MAG: 16S rRNA (guanine(966)-N(2))-methyltransferase RsmD [Chloroflexia bacterium]|nr:16S rRNA (guanine(966)-N(2))-methyltransferase RsmD [Chloroflexia bacterium]
MRVITGKAKGHKLKGPKNLRTRPMLDKVRGSLFAVLEGFLGEFYGRVLDLYAGTGALGIEALSRGAEWADFVEVNASVCRIIRDNLAHTKLAGQARVHQGRVESFIKGMHKGTNYDIIFMDPPYADPGIGETISTLAVSPLVHEETLVAVGHSARLELGEGYGPLRRLRQRRLGDSAYSIYGMPAWWQEEESDVVPQEAEQDVNLS